MVLFTMFNIFSMIMNTLTVFSMFRLKSYSDDDCGPDDAIPTFRPKLVPGIQLHDVKTRDDKLQYISELSFFKLFFTHELIDMICLYTNRYAAATGHHKPSLFKGWIAVSPNEMYRYIGLLFYMAVVNLPRLNLYWSTSVLFHGTWARSFISSMKRFKQISGFLKVSNFENEDKTDKICKVRFLHDYIRRKSMKHFQPDEHVSIDERMVRNKGRYAFRQYMKDKPTKWGMKLWVVADAVTGYTYDFEVYTGKTRSGPSKLGLGYDVCMRLMKSLFRQGYKLFIDNYYSSVQLIIDLLKCKTTTCGTILVNRKGIPIQMKASSKKKGERGTVRWVRQGNVVFFTMDR